MKSIKDKMDELSMPDRTTHTISVKIPLETHRAVVAYAGRRTSELGTRVTESDVIRAILTEWLATAEARR